MSSLAETMTASGAPFLWIDDRRYTERLFNVPRKVWVDGAELAAYRRKAIGLLRSNVNLCSLDDVMEVWLARNQGILDAMRAKRRPLVPLRTLLQAESLKSIAREMAGMLALSLGSVPLALTLRSPRQWIVGAYAAAFGSEPELEDDDVDSASVYVAEFLRVFDSAGVAGVLLDVSQSDKAVTPDEVQLFQPVRNVATHYRWDIGLRVSPGSVGLETLSGFSFACGCEPSPDLAVGIETPKAFWAGGVAPTAPARTFRYVEIPEDTAPEIVLERLARLKDR